MPIWTALYFGGHVILWSLDSYFTNFNDQLKILIAFTKLNNNSSEFKQTSALIYLNFLFLLQNWSKESW